MIDIYGIFDRYKHVNIRENVKVFIYDYFAYLISYLLELHHRISYPHQQSLLEARFIRFTYVFFFTVIAPLIIYSLYFQNCLYLFII